MDLDLVPAAPREVTHGPFGAPDVARQSVPCGVGQRRQRLLERGVRAGDVVEQLGRGAGGTGLDLGGPALVAARVLVDDLAPRRALGPPADGVGVAGDVGQQVPDAPPRQPAGQAGVVVVQTRHRRLEPPVHVDDPTDVVVRRPRTHAPPTVPLVLECQRGGFVTLTLENDGHRLTTVPRTIVATTSKVSSRTTTSAMAPGRRAPRSVRPSTAAGDDVAAAMAC